MAALAQFSETLARRRNTRPSVDRSRVIEMRQPAWLADNDRLTAATGWTPTTPLNQGLAPDPPLVPRQQLALMTSLPPDARPLLSVDIDGVLARPPLGESFWMNRDLSLTPRPLPLPNDPPPNPSATDRLLRAAYYRWRYAGRSPMPGARDALQAATDAGYRLIALTGRDWRGRRPTERWLARHQMLPLFETLRMNDSGRFGHRLSSPRFKEAVCVTLGIARHIEDDPATAALLARNGLAVDLIDWSRSRTLPLPSGVTRRANLADPRRRLRLPHSVHPEESPARSLSRAQPRGRGSFHPPPARPSPAGSGSPLSFPWGPPHE